MSLLDQLFLLAYVGFIFNNSLVSNWPITILAISTWFLHSIWTHAPNVYVFNEGHLYLILNTHLKILQKTMQVKNVYGCSCHDQTMAQNPNAQHVCLWVINTDWQVWFYFFKLAFHQLFLSTMSQRYTHWEHFNKFEHNHVRCGCHLVINDIPKMNVYQIASDWFNYNR